MIIVIVIVIIIIITITIVVIILSPFGLMKGLEVASQPH